MHGIQSESTSYFITKILDFLIDLIVNFVSMIICVIDVMALMNMLNSTLDERQKY